jgi:hypothetical protein
MEHHERAETSEESGQPTSRPRSPRISEHAQQRRTEGRRISPGYSDAQQAQASAVFLQPNGRFVVRGPRGREHVFARDGTHITSIDRSHRAHLRLVRLGKRAPVTAEQFEQFKEQFT